MDEARRFLRYILPGLVFPVMLLITLLISDTDKIISFLGKNSDKEIIGVIGGVFLASGALGYIFSVIYWALYWSWPLERYIAIDHKPLLKGLTEMGKVEVVNIPGNRVDLDKISKREASVIFSQHWWTSRIKNEVDRDKFISIDRLADIMHAIGASIISILSSLAAWAIIHFLSLKSEFSICKVLGPIIVLILLIIAFGKNYWDIRISIRLLLHSSFANMVEDQYKGNRRKIKIYYDEIV